MQLTRRSCSLFVVALVLLVAGPARAAFTPIPLQHSIDAAHRNFETRIGGSIENVEVFSITYILAPISFEEYVQQVIATWPLKIASGRLYSNVDPMGTDHLAAYKYNQVRSSWLASDPDGIAAWNELRDLRVELVSLKSELLRIPTTGTNCNTWKNWVLSAQTDLKNSESKWWVWWKYGRHLGLPRPDFAVADPDFVSTLSFWWAPGYLDCHPWEAPWALNAAQADYTNYMWNLSVGSLAYLGTSAGAGGLGLAVGSGIEALGAYGNLARLPQLLKVTERASYLRATGVRAPSGYQFMQEGYSTTFSKKGLFSGQTLGQVIQQLKGGALTPAQVPVHYFELAGQRIIADTRSYTALARAGISPSSINFIKLTDPVRLSQVMSRYQRSYNIVFPNLLLR